MAIVGYGRVSTVEQSLSIQLDALKKYGCDKIFSERVTGTTKDGRSELKNALDYMRDGDTFVVTRIDRLARSMRDLQNIAHDLKKQDISLVVIEQNVDTSTSAGRAFFNMLGVFAEFETDLRKERQAEGIAKAKLAGKYKGRKPTASNQSNDVLSLLGEGLGKAEVARRLNMSRQSVYRIINANKVANDVMSLLSEGLGKTEVARRFNMSRQSVYRIINANKVAK